MVDKIIILVVICITIFSCSKDKFLEQTSRNNIVIQNRSDILAELEELKSVDFSGDISLVSEQIALGISERKFKFEAYFENNTSVVTNECDLHLGSFNYLTTALNNNTVRDTGAILQSMFYGQDHEFSFIKSNGDTLASGTFRYPEPIDLVLGTTQFSEINGTPVFNRNSSSLSWNADTTNTYGVLILVEYIPDLNPTLRSQYSDRVTEFIHIEDTGSYTFSSNDVNEIPNNSNVYLRVFRGNYKVLKYNDENYLFSAISQIKGTAYLE